MIDTLIARVKGFLIDPVETFRQSRTDEAGAVVKYLLALLLIDAFLTAVVAFVGVTAFGMFTRYFPGYAVPVIVFFGVLIGGIILAALFSLWVHFWVILAGGRKGLLQTGRAVVYGMTLGLLLGWIPLVGFLFTLWAIVLQIIGIRELHGISGERALLAMIAAIMIPVIIIIFIAAWFFVSTVSVSQPVMVSAGGNP